MTRGAWRFIVEVLILQEKGREGSIDCKSIRVEQGAISTIDRVSTWNSSYSFGEEALQEKHVLKWLETQSRSSEGDRHRWLSEGARVVDLVPGSFNVGSEFIKWYQS
jgi:hypothetical protein